VNGAISKILDSNPTGRIYGEYLFNRIIIEAWNAGALGSLDMTRENFSYLMQQHGWFYDGESHQWRKGVLQSEPLFAS